MLCAKVGAVPACKGKVLPCTYVYCFARITMKGIIMCDQFWLHQATSMCNESQGKESYGIAGPAEG